MKFVLVTALACIGSAVGPSTAGPDGEWAKGIPYTTDWKAAIRDVRQTGRMLLIYNGWQRSGI